MNISHAPALLLTLALAGAAAANPELPPDPLAKEIRELREEVASLRRLDRATSAEVKLLTERLERIEKSLKELSSRSGPFRSEFTPATPRVAIGTGTLRLDNRLPVTAYVTIDGVEYSVAPQTVRRLTGRAAGTIGYSITADGMGVGPMTRTPLAAGESLTLTIY